MYVVQLKLAMSILISFSNALWGGVTATGNIYIPLVVTSDCIFQTRSLPREAPRRPREGLAKAESIHNAPVISISRFDFFARQTFTITIVFFRFFIF